MVMPGNDARHDLLQHGDTTMATKKVGKAEPFHFYGSTAYDWVTGPSREFVLKKLASYLTGMLKKGTSGVECVVCRVELPQAAHYTIRNYVPNAITIDGKPTEKRVPLRQYERLVIMDSKGTAIQNPGLTNPTDEELAADDDKPVVRRAWD
jgi:hypothetical protein